MEKSKKLKRNSKTANLTNGEFKYSPGQFFNFNRGSYLERTSRPIYAVVFLLPFILFYELGTFLINTNILNQFQIRVAAFVWMQNFMNAMGIGGKFAWAAPGLAVVIILLSLQITSGKKWTVWFSDLVPMTLECILLAVPLIVLTLFLASASSQERPDQFNNISKEVCSYEESLISCSSVHDNDIPISAFDNQNTSRTRILLAKITTGIGAGIYEELVFRLIMISILMLLFQDALKLNQFKAAMISILIAAVLFSAHHHIDFLTGRSNIAGSFNTTEFVFRAIAGVYFAILFAIRGFGITAGTHAFYDIIAVFITTFFYNQ